MQLLKLYQNNKVIYFKIFLLHIFWSRNVPLLRLHFWWEKISPMAFCMPHSIVTESTHFRYKYDLWRIPKDRSHMVFILDGKCIWRAFLMNGLYPKLEWIDRFAYKPVTEINPYTLSIYCPDILYTSNLLWLIFVIVSLTKPRCITKWGLKSSGKIEFFSITFFLLVKYFNYIQFKSLFSMIPTVFSSLILCYIHVKCEKSESYCFF